jgi:hypothetical protein
MIKINSKIVLGVLALATQLGATVKLDTQFGLATDSNGVAVPDGTLWALIVDNGDNRFGGTFGLDTSLKTFAATNAGLINSTFAGKSLSIGSTFSGDTIFAVGGFNGEALLNYVGGTSNTVEGLDTTLNGLSTGANFAFLYFPGVRFLTESDTYSIGSQIGGVNSSIPDAGASIGGLVIPAEGSVALGVSTPGDLGGSFPADSFQAINLVPEPSSAFLASLGALGLLRRRRN